MVKGPGRGGNDLPGEPRILLAWWAAAFLAGVTGWAALIRLAVT